MNLAIMQQTNSRFGAHSQESWLTKTLNPLPFVSKKPKPKASSFGIEMSKIEPANFFTYKYNKEHHKYMNSKLRLSQFTQKIEETDVEEFFQKIHANCGGQIQKATEVVSDCRTRGFSLTFCLGLAILSCLMLKGGTWVLVLGSGLLFLSVIFIIQGLFFAPWDQANYNEFVKDLESRMDIIISDENKTKFAKLGLVWSRGKSWDELYITKTQLHDEEIRIEFTELI